jgi:F-type H+-transporting ATPase subunit a
MNPILAAGGFTWFHGLRLPSEVDMPAIRFGETVLQEAGPMPMDPLYHSLFALAILTLMGFSARRSLNQRAGGPDGLVPEDRMSSRTFFELFVQGYYAFLEPLLGKHMAKHFPLLATLFLYILFCNVLGLLPGFLPSTSNISTNIGMALAVFIIYNYSGIREHGLVSYLKHFAGPVLWLAPLMFVLEVVSHVFRPLSLSVRLFGNMTGDHAVLETFLHLSYGALIPVIFLGLGLFVCLVQALVFSLLSAVYLSIALAHEEEGAH